jgi:hypothetical protein
LPEKKTGTVNRKKMKMKIQKWRKKMKIMNLLKKFKK